ncbi:MAG: hypothetical protein PHC41_13890 [Lachnospiraceae bacterium]|jgi:hypothetical protein|nr:hypothetical protein [Lachnospiraceae bacterium]MDD3617296.1 hypothetical protein [Lachnospiraceae bacterium]
MNLKGMNVTHKKFGTGKIVNIVEDKMEVDFKCSIKTFLYPYSFEKFIVMEDPDTQEYVTRRLGQLNEIKRAQKEQQLKKIQADTYAKKMRKKTNSQAVFAMKENTLEDVVNNNSIFTGNNLSGKTKGQARVPKNMNINSACLITSKSSKESESERSIVGIFMVPEDFIGERCIDGMIPAHQDHFILWNEEHEKLLFWNYFPEESRLAKWGNSEMKYVPIAIVQNVLTDMVNLTQGEEQHDKAVEFYQYFRDMNV